MKDVRKNFVVLLKILEANIIMASIVTLLLAFNILFYCKIRDALQSG